MIDSAKATSQNSDQQSSQAFIFHQPSGQEKLSLGVLISGQGADSFTDIKLVANLLEDKFFVWIEPVPARLTKAFQLIQSRLAKVEGLEVLLAVWRESANGSCLLYLQSIGQPSAYLARQNHLVLLSSGQSGMEVGQLISGHFEKGDTLVLLNSTLKRLLDGVSDTPDEALNKFSKIETSDLEEEVVSLAHFSKATTPVAAIMVNYPKGQTPVAVVADQRSAVIASPVSAPVAIPPRSRLKFTLPKVRIPRLPKFNLSKLLRLLKTSKKAKIGALAIVIFLIAFAVWGGLKGKQDNSKQQQFNSLIDQSKQKYQFAKDLKDLNATEAKTNLTEAKKLLAEALALRPKDKTALDLQQELDRQSKEILKEYEVTDFPLFLGLDLVKSGFQSKIMASYEDNLLFLDDKNKTLVSLNLKNKSNQILAGSDQIGSANKIALTSTFAFVFAPDKGITRIDLGAKKSSPVIPTDSFWGQIEDLYSFASNLYLLDDVKNSVWKYVPASSGNGYSDRNSYLAEDAKVELLGARRMIIDGSIWILKGKNEIQKLTSGGADFFTPKDLDLEFGNLKSFYLSDETENIYFLDSDNNRMVVTKKSGEYLYQFSGSKFKTADDLYVNEKDKKLYLLEGNSIYQLDLK